MIYICGAGDSPAHLALDQSQPSTESVNPADTGRYYSFDWGDAHFTSLDSNLMPTAAADRMLAWLDNDPSFTEQIWKIASYITRLTRLVTTSTIPSARRCARWSWNSTMF